MENYEGNKKIMNKFREKVLNYFKENKYDVTIEQIFEDLKLNVGNLNLLEYFLAELVEKKLIRKSVSMNHLEYDLEDGE